MISSRIESVVIFLGYMVASYYMTRKEVNERFKLLEFKSTEEERLLKRRIDELETQIRRIEALNDFRLKEIIKPLIARRDRLGNDDEPIS